MKLKIHGTLIENDTMLLLLPAFTSDITLRSAWKTACVVSLGLFRVLELSDCGITDAVLYTLCEVCFHKLPLL